MSDYNAYLLRRQQQTSANAPAVQVSQSTSFDALFNSLDEASGGHNQVSLTALRSALGGSRASQDATIAAVRGRYFLETADCDDAMRQSAYNDDFGSYHFIARR